MIGGRASRRRRLATGYRSATTSRGIVRGPSNTPVRATSQSAAMECHRRNLRRSLSPRSTRRKRHVAGERRSLNMRGQHQTLPSGLPRSRADRSWISSKRSSEMRPRNNRLRQRIATTITGSRVKWKAVKLGTRHLVELRHSSSFQLSRQFRKFSSFCSAST